MVIQTLLVFLFLSTVHAGNECPAAYCDSNGDIIRFPFWLQGSTQSHSSCAPSGFNLSCHGQRYPILHISGTGDFYVRSVYYYLRRVVLQNVEGCLPMQLLSLNLSSTPFMAVEYRNYTFFVCPKGHVNSTGVVECTSNATSDVFATIDSAGFQFSECSKIAAVPIPFSSTFDNRFPAYLELTWRDPPTDKTVPNCPNCGSTRGGRNKISDSSRITLILMIPILFILFVVAVLTCIKKQGSGHHSSSSIQTPEAGGLTSRGLDKSTIEALKTITIEESRAEGPNDVTCTICLTDYAPNETIRLMPTCEHCFHMECIDKWLSMSRKCPICRVSLRNTKSC